MMKATMTPPETNRKAMEQVTLYETEKRHRKLTNVSREGVGYDFESFDPKTGETITIEVKGCGSDEGIPNANIRNFEGPPRKRKLKADFLYVVQFDGRKAVALRIIPKDVVDSYRHGEVHAIKLAHALKTRVKHGEFDAPDFKGS